jgi:hypothetical protein
MCWARSTRFIGRRNGLVRWNNTRIIATSKFVPIPGIPAGTFPIIDGELYLWENELFVAHQ